MDERELEGITPHVQQNKSFQHWKDLEWKSTNSHPLPFPFIFFQNVIQTQCYWIIILLKCTLHLTCLQALIVSFWSNCFHSFRKEHFNSNLRGSSIGCNFFTDWCWWSDNKNRQWQRVLPLHTQEKASSHRMISLQCYHIWEAKHPFTPRKNVLHSFL